MKKQQVLATVSAGVISLGLVGSADAALVSRLGGLAYYDDVADLTWLADANAAGRTMSWAKANTWAANLDVHGVTGWRLPDTIDVGDYGANHTNFYQGVDSGYNITTHSELSNMFYNVLGNLAFYDTAGNALQLGWGLTNTGPFSNLKKGLYWSATESIYTPNTYNAWMFNMTNGYQGHNYKIINSFAWAVQSGDVSVVPVPAAVWLFASGLMGLAGFARRKRGV